MIRIATSDDTDLVRELARAFEREIPDELWGDDGTDPQHDVVFLADTLGIAAVDRKSERTWLLDLLYVRPEARGKGLGTELLRAAAEHVGAQGGEMLALEVVESNSGARRLYDRLGFKTVERVLAAPVAGLVERPSGPTLGTIHVQTDDSGAAEKVVAKTLPRLGKSAHTEVAGPENGWVAVRDELCSHEPRHLKALAQELSYSLASVVLALGIEEGEVVRYNLYDRGSVVDEYLSVPEYYGELPPGDVIALGANPTVVARLTGADPQRVREIARTAKAPADLPAAQELYELIAETIGVTV